MDLNLKTPFFLRIDGIEGESQVAHHEGEIDIRSWSWEENQSGTSSVGAGRVSMQDFKFSMFVNKATPKLIVACASGTRIKEAVLSCHKAIGDSQIYLQYKFFDLIISSYKTGVANAGSPDKLDLMPLEEITFNYSRIEVEYRQQQEDGTLGGVVCSGWDLKKNQRV